MTGAMLFVNGKRVFCWCGASVFHVEDSDHTTVLTKVYVCNGCGERYEST